MRVELLEWVLAEGLDEICDSNVLEWRCGSAARRGHLPLLKSMYTVTNSWLMGTVCLEAAKGGKVNVLTWAKENGAPWVAERRFWRGNYGCYWEQSVCREAAERGHIQVLQWLKENFDCQWEWWHFGKGKLEALKWLRERGCDWHSDACVMASKRGDLEVLKWAMEQGCPWQPEI